MCKAGIGQWADVNAKMGGVILSNLLKLASSDVCHSVQPDKCKLIFFQAELPYCLRRSNEALDRLYFLSAIVPRVGTNHCECRLCLLDERQMVSK